MATPADSNAIELIGLGDRLFAKKAQLDTLHQLIAEQIYPERANFTRVRAEGEEYAQWLYESGPAQDRRDLAGSIGAITRPRGKEWFKPVPSDDARKTSRALKWCDHAKDVTRRLLYTAKSRFQKVYADGDDDFVSFGNAITVLTENPERNGFLFELSHLRDNAWSTNRYDEVDVNHRKIKKTVRWVAQKYGADKLTAEQKVALEKNPYELVDIRHVLMPAEDYDPYLPRRKWQGRPYASIYINVAARTILNEGGYFEFPMLHRRWRVPDDSVYGYSPAAMLGLVDARVLQAQSRIIMDAGELRVAPPLIAKRDAILGGVNNFAGAVTWLDTEYDERLGDAIRPLDTGGDVRLGLEMKVDTRAVLKAAFYLDKLNLPSDKDMTAYEISERVAQYIRSAGPIFEPFESDNAQMLDAVFKMALRLGYYGPIDEIPPELRGGEIKWDFDGPVQQAYSMVKVAKARQTIEAVKPLADVDPEVLDEYDLKKMARDVGEAIGGEEAWRRDPAEVEKIRAGRAKQAAEMEHAQKTDAMLGMADKAGSAGAKFAQIAQNPQLMAMFQKMMQGGMGGGQPPQDPLAGFPQPEDDGMGGLEQMEAGPDQGGEGQEPDLMRMIEQVAGKMDGNQAVPFPSLAPPGGQGGGPQRALPPPRPMPQRMGA